MSTADEREHLALLRGLVRQPPQERSVAGLRRLADDPAAFETLVSLAEVQHLAEWLAFHGLGFDRAASRRYLLEPATSSSNAEAARSTTPARGSSGMALPRLREVHERATERAALCEATVRPLLARLSESGPAFLVLDDQLLAHSVYPAPWIRAGSEVALLVRRPEREAIDGVLRRSGFLRRVPDPEHRFSGEVGPERIWQRRLPEGELIRVSVRTALLDERFRVDSAALFARAEPFVWHGLELSGLSTLDLFVSLLLRSCTDPAGNPALRTLVDLNQLYEERALVWSEVEELALEWGGAQIAWLVLDALRCTFGIDVPVPTLERLGPPLLLRCWAALLVRAVVPPFFRLTGPAIDAPLARVFCWTLLDTCGQRLAAIRQALDLGILDWAVS